MEHNPTTGLDPTNAAVNTEAVRSFAAALARTLEFQRYEPAAARLEADAAARAAMLALQQRQKSLEALIRLNAASPEEQAELEQLRQAFIAQPAVIAYVQAEASLKAICQSVGDLLSQSIGLDFAAACRTGCC
jgi:cell fate (sporulation/competence/biofilm development) regulator YlbF (YheA/YmcA/DUF963 family)